MSRKNDDDASNWTVGDASAQEDGLKGLARAEVVPLEAFESVEEALRYVRDHKLEAVARREGATVGVSRTYKRGVGYQVEVERPRGWRPRRGR